VCVRGGGSEHYTAVPPKFDLDYDFLNAFLMRIGKVQIVSIGLGCYC